MHRPSAAGLRSLIAPLAIALALLVTSAQAVAALSSDYPYLSAGNRGVDIKALQHLLRHRGHDVRVDGVFGPATVAAVKALQAARGLAITGHADPATWNAVRVPVELGSEGEAVLGLKKLLNEKRRAGLAVTPVFDAATRDAVIGFQQHARLIVNGRAGAAVWQRLVAHLELPVWGTTLCDYSVGNGTANWGTSEAIGQLQAAAAMVAAQGHGRVAVGDIGFEHGGDIPGHETHEHGLDVDLRPMRDARDQCRWGGSYRYAAYDRAATRALVKAIRATAPGHIKLIYFNDPVLIGEGLVRRHEGHDDHLHVRYCERVHPIAAYDC